MKRKLDDQEDRGSKKTMMAVATSHGGDGKLWVRGPKIGKGGFGSVFMAESKSPLSTFSFLPVTMAVKSAEMSKSATLQNEKEVLFNLRGSPYVIRCFGEETTTADDGSMVYNLLLEHVSGGTLASLIRKMKVLPESDVKHYTRSLLLGIKHIHDSGYVHCDLKPDNVLLVPWISCVKFLPVITDFGLAARAGTQTGWIWERTEVGGTPRYMAPEVVSEGLQETPSDIWGLGCIVLEMLTGKPVWSHREDVKTADEILALIDSDTDKPYIPPQLSKDAKDFIICCLVWYEDRRWTAEMLLNHPFVADFDNAEGVNTSSCGWLDESDLPDFEAKSDVIHPPVANQYKLHTPADIAIETRGAAPGLLCQ